MTEGNHYNWHESLMGKVKEDMRIGDDLIIISESIVPEVMTVPRNVDVTTDGVLSEDGNRRAVGVVRRKHVHASLGEIDEGNYVCEIGHKVAL